MPCPTRAPAFALARYQGVPRRLVLAYKERGRRDLAPALGAALADALAATAPLTADSGTAGCCLVPVPSRPVAARMRGGPHMLRLARHCASRAGQAGIRVGATQALRLAAGAADAVGLDAEARAANLAGRVLPVPGALPQAGARVVLLDDVITTGATAMACERVLTRGDVSVVAVLALTSPRCAASHPPSE